MGIMQSISKQSALPKMWIESLLKSEIADRKARLINYQMGAARFPVHRDISNFDFESSVVLEDKIRVLDYGVNSSSLNVCVANGKELSLSYKSLFKKENEGVP